MTKPPSNVFKLLHENTKETPARLVHGGFTTKINHGQQKKHIVGTNNYAQEIAKGNTKSIFYGTVKDAQELVNEYAGTGLWFPKSHVEKVNFHRVIGLWVNPDTGETRQTTCGTIHYSAKGAHIVPAYPEEE